jgi:hypothetical protein
MKRGGWVVAVVVGSCWAGVAAAAPPAGKPPVVEAVTFDIHHRVFPNFFEQSRVRLKQSFAIGDTKYSARVVRFVPDFDLNLKTHKVVSITNEPNNPAFQVIVREKGVPQDTVWAFLNMPPHFARNSMLAFQVRRIDFVGRAPMLGDTSSAGATGK